MTKTIIAIIAELSWPFIASLATSLVAIGAHYFYSRTEMRKEIKITIGGHSLTVEINGNKTEDDVSDAIAKAINEDNRKSEDILRSPSS